MCRFGLSCVCVLLFWAVVRFVVVVCFVCFCVLVYCFMLLLFCRLLFLWCVFDLLSRFLLFVLLFVFVVCLFS